MESENLSPLSNKAKQKLLNRSTLAVTKETVNNKQAQKILQEFSIAPNFNLTLKSYTGINKIS